MHAATVPLPLPLAPAAEGMTGIVAPTTVPLPLPLAPAAEGMTGIVAPTPARTANAGKAGKAVAVAVAVEGSLPAATRLQTLSAVKMVRQLIRLPPPLHPPPHFPLQFYLEYLTNIYI